MTHGTQGHTPNDVFKSGIDIVKLTITDKIIGVYQASIQLLTNICFNGTNLRFSQSETQELKLSGEQILTTLIDKLGDNLLKVRKNSDEAIIAMCMNQTFGFRICVLALTKQVRKDPTNTKKTVNSNKLLVGRY